MTLETKQAIVVRHCPVTSMTSSSELLPPFSVRVGCVSGRLNAAPSRLEVERKLGVAELEAEAEVGAEERVPPGCREELGNILEESGRRV